MFAHIPANQLQSQIAAQTSYTVPAGQRPVTPHHPITCSSDIRLEDDGAFSCPHAAVPADDPRTQAALNSAAAYLLLEQLFIMERRQAS